MPEEMRDKIDAFALKLRDEMLSESILHLLPYLDPCDMNGISYARMEHELPEDVIERAKARMLDNLRAKVAEQIADREHS